MRTTVRRKFGSQSAGDAISRLPPSGSTSPSSPILLLASVAGVGHPWPSMTRTHPMPGRMRPRRRIAPAALLLLCTAALVLVAASPAAAQGETIRSYDVQIEVH